MITPMAIFSPAARRLNRSSNLNSPTRQGDSGGANWHGVLMNIDTVHPDTSPPALPDSAHVEMAGRASEATAYLKSLAHEGRLMILCHLSTGEHSVGELETLLNLRQSAVSQMLARLREDGLVSTRREGKIIHYSLSDSNTQQVIGLLYSLFCGPDSET